MYLKSVYLNDKRQLNELKYQYEGRVKALNEEIQSWVKKAGDSATSKKQKDEINSLIRKKEEERDGYYDMVCSLNYAIECIDYVAMTRDLINRQPPMREVWAEEGEDG